MTEQSPFSVDSAITLLDALPNVVIYNLAFTWPAIGPQPRAAWRTMLANGEICPGAFIRAAWLYADLYDVEPSTTRPLLRLVRGGGA